jgi:hypothetical protein
MEQTNIAGISWIDANSNRRYPLDDRSFGSDDAGQSLPLNLLADMNVWFPDSLGKGLYVSAVTIGVAVITVALAAHPQRPGQGSDPVTFVPVGTVTVVKPVVSGKNYPIDPAQDGIGGWLAFGQGVNDIPAGSWRFSHPAASGVLPRLARAYPPPGVTTIGKFGTSTRLTGVVNLASSTTDLLIVEKSTVMLGITPHEAIVVRLNTQGAGRDVLGKFPGRNGSPINGTCQRKPITSINGVKPDCNGVLTLVIDDAIPDGKLPLLRVSFANQAQDGHEPAVNAYSTLSLELDKGMSEVCKPNPTTLSTDVSTPCFDPCAPWDAVGPFGGKSGSFATPPSNEPGMDGGKSFMTISDPITIDLSSTNEVTPEGYAAGVLILIRASDTVTQSPSDGSFVAGGTVTFNLPASAIVIRDTVGSLVSPASSGGITTNPASARKVFNFGSGSAIVPFGGSIDPSLAHVDTLFNSTLFSMGAFGGAISKDLLSAKGYLSGSNMVYRYVLIASGQGSTVNISLATGTPSVDDGCTSSASST